MLTLSIQIGWNTNLVCWLQHKLIPQIENIQLSEWELLHEQ